MSNEDFLIPYYNSYSESEEIFFNNNNVEFKYFLYYIKKLNFYNIYVFNENKIYYSNFNYNYVNDYNNNLYGSLLYTFDDNYNIIRCWKKNNICYGILHNYIIEDNVRIYNNNYIIFNIENNINNNIEFNIINSFKFNLPDNIDIDNIYLQEFKINDNIYFSFIYLNKIYYFDFINNSLKNINIIGIFIECDNEHKYILLPEETTSVDIYNFQTKNYNTISISNNQLDKNDLITFSGFYKNINNIDYFYFISFLKINNNSYFYQYINGEEYISLFNQNIIYNTDKLFYIAYIHTFNNLTNDLPIYLILSNNINNENNNENNNVLIDMYNSIFDYWYLMCNNQYIIINIMENNINYYNIYELIYDVNDNNNFIPIDIILNDTSYKFHINKYDYFNIDRFINNNLFYHTKDNDIDKFNIKKENRELIVSNNIKLSSIEKYPSSNSTIIIIKNTNYIIKKYFDNFIDIIKQYNINDYIYYNNKFYCITNSQLLIFDNSFSLLKSFNINDKIINISKNNNSIYLYTYNNNNYIIYEIIYTTQYKLNIKKILTNKSLLDNELIYIYYIDNDNYYYYKQNNNKFYLFNKNNNIFERTINKNSYSYINLINNILFASDNKYIYYIDNTYNVYNKILFDNDFNNNTTLINYYTYIDEDVLNIVLLYINNDNDKYYYQTLIINKKMLMYKQDNNDTSIKRLYYIMNTIKKSNTNYNMKYNVHLDNTNYIMKHETL